MTENAPPNLKLPKDLKIPDLITGGRVPAPEAAKPSSSTAEKAANPVMEKPNTVPLPKPPEVPSMALSLKPAVLSPPPPALKLAVQLPEIPTPRLEVPPPPPPVKATAPPTAQVVPLPPQPAPHETAHPAAETSPALPPDKPPAPAAASDTPKPGGGPKIMALSVDPIPLKDAIPAGQYMGAFSISPSGSVRGSSGGGVGKPPDVGEGGHGAGGDKSVAGGNGNPGGGGPGKSTANPSSSLMVSVSGSAGSPAISAGTLAPLKAEDLVYAVTPETPKAHAPSLVVSSGSWGGGGLRIFGVLHGDKIYTVYFSMPGKNWILQYCAHENAAQVDAASRVVQIHITPPVAPPEAIEQFDFHRPTEPSDAAPALIVLHGIIHEDGSVSDLAVLQGLDPISNAAACAAFSRWKFKPARRAGIPVAVEILVGIP